MGLAPEAALVASEMYGSVTRRVPSVVSDRSARQTSPWKTKAEIKAYLNDSLEVREDFNKEADSEDRKDRMAIAALEEVTNYRPNPVLRFLWSSNNVYQKEEVALLNVIRHWRYLLCGEGGGGVNDKHELTIVHEE
jgi:hypothetical protein